MGARALVESLRHDRIKELRGLLLEVSNRRDLMNVQANQWLWPSLRVAYTSVVRWKKIEPHGIMRNPVWPILIASLSLIVIGAAVFSLQGSIHSAYLPAPGFPPPGQPLVLKGLREYYLVPAGFVIFFGVLAVAHAKASRFRKWLYLVQLGAGALFLAILVASGLQARKLFLHGPPSPIWVGQGEAPESVKSRKK